VRELDVGYRVPRQILDFASRLLPVIAPELRPASSLRADPSSLSVVAVPGGKMGTATATACSEALEAPGSVAVICADAQVGDVSRALRAAGLAFGVLGSPASAAHQEAAGQADAGQGEAGQEAAGQRLAVVPVTLAKGLEFDHVVLVEPAAIAAGEAHGLRRLYVGLTRAVSRLVVLYAEPLPSALRYVP
jgi:DNA helicase IV